MEHLGAVSAVCLATILAIALVSDLRTSRIPNWLTFPGMAAGMVIHTIGSGPKGLLVGAGGMLVGTGLFIVPYLMGGMGAGDAKLMGAVGSFLGPAGAFKAFLFIALCGGIYAIILMAAYGVLAQRVRGCWSMMRSVLLTRRIAGPQREDAAEADLPRLRYGIAIAVGTIVSLLWEREVTGISFKGILN